VSIASRRGAAPGQPRWVRGSVDRVGDFDRWFRPRPPVDRQRWIDLDRAGRAGAIIPPIEVYRVGRLHFVRDGHHRVSVARAHGQRSIDAYVTEVTTGTAGGLGRAEEGTTTG